MSLKNHVKINVKIKALFYGLLKGLFYMVSKVGYKVFL